MLIMEKVKGILALIIIIALITLYYTQQIPTPVSTTQPQPEVAKLASYISRDLCTFKNNTGYSLCCMSDNTSFDCSDRKSFRCGQEIGFMATIELDGKHGNYCFSGDSLPYQTYNDTGIILYNDTKLFVCEDYSQSNKTRHLFFVAFIPVNRTEITFSEVYAFPRNVTYSSIYGYLDNLSQADKIISAKVGVTCS